MYSNHAEQCCAKSCCSSGKNLSEQERSEKFVIQAKTDYFSFHKYNNSVNSASERKWHTVTCGEEAAGRCASCLVTMAAAILCAAAVDDNDSQKRVLLQSKHIKCKTACMFAQPCTKNMMEISISELQTPDSFWTISPAPTEWELVSVLRFFWAILSTAATECGRCRAFLLLSHHRQCTAPFSLQRHFWTQNRKCTP